MVASDIVHNGSADIPSLKNSAFIPVLRQASNNYKTEIMNDISNNLLHISKSDNRIIACREWIISLLDESAPIMAFTIVNHKNDHPCLKESLYDLSDKIIKESFYDTYRMIGDMQDCLDYFINEALKYQFLLELANFARIMLKDCKVGVGDWYLPYVLSAIAYHDAIYRDELGLSSKCNMPELLVEYYSIRENLEKGYKDPLQDIQFAGT